MFSDSAASAWRELPRRGAGRAGGRRAMAVRRPRGQAGARAVGICLSFIEMRLDAHRELVTNSTRALVLSEPEILAEVLARAPSLLKDVFEVFGSSNYHTHMVVKMAARWSSTRRDWRSFSRRRRGNRRLPRPGGHPRGALLRRQTAVRGGVPARRQARRQARRNQPVSRRATSMAWRPDAPRHFEDTGGNAPAGAKTRRAPRGNDGRGAGARRRDVRRL